jgi:hypothetical protein
MPEPAVRLFSELRKTMMVTQALVFMGFFNQFPIRYRGSEDWYFKPDEKAIQKSMRIAGPAYYVLVSNLVLDGYLKRRKARSGGYEYRIHWERIKDLVGTSEDVKESTT